MRVLMDTVRPRRDGKNPIQIHNWPEENADSWVVDEKHEGMRNTVVAVSIK